MSSLSSSPSLSALETAMNLVFSSFDWWMTPEVAPPIATTLLKNKGDHSSHEQDSFAYTINTTSHTKAIHFSIVMMLVCLMQILLLLQQLLRHWQQHRPLSSQQQQQQVSIVCIAWQAILDALLCLGHFYFCMALPPLFFTAFASVAFSKFLMCCVIEMKYVSLILQARNAAQGGHATDALKQVGLFLVRFYIVLVVLFALLFQHASNTGSVLNHNTTHHQQQDDSTAWYSFENSHRFERRIYLLALYSFWVPQIVRNIWTQSKTPLHYHFICGMSLTRLVVPLYVFGWQSNFLHAVYRTKTATLWWYDPTTCLWLVAWMTVQTVIVLGQGSRQGARYGIPSVFLPPKYNYHRPIPPSVWENQQQQTHDQGQVTTNENASDLEPATFDRATVCSYTASPPSSSSVWSASHPSLRQRLRRKRDKSNAVSNEHSSTSKTPTNVGSVSRSSFTSWMSSSITKSTTCCELECSICLEPIVDATTRPTTYMLAPCNHVFHKTCLLQWMEIKLKCPTCRTQLPPV